MSDYLDQVLKESNSSILMEYLELDRPGVAKTIAGSKNASADVLAKLVFYKLSSVRNVLARNLNASPEVFKQLLQDSEVAVRDSARFSLARLSRPVLEIATVVEKVKSLDSVIEEIKKEKTNKKDKNNKNKKAKK